MRRVRLHREDGWALVTAVTLLAVMLTIGLATFSVVDTNTRQSRVQRERESSLNLAEGVLYAQGFVLARQWPGAGKAAYPQQCTSGSPTDLQCPNRDTLSAANSATPGAANFRSTDFLADGSWITAVRDNYGPLAQAYDPALANSQLTGPLGTCPGPVAAQPGPCTRDFNDDRALWVQARTVVRGEPRNVVALLKLEELVEDVPKAAVTAGAISVTNRNNSERATIDGTGSEVIVRCDPSNPNCANYRDGDITPRPGQSEAPRLMTTEQLNRFKERAKIDGRYYAGCPTRDPVTGQYDLGGAVVFVEGCTDPPTLGNQIATRPCNPPAPEGMSQACINQITKSGVLIWHCGRADFQGGFTYVGLIYHVNNSDGTCAIPSKEGGACNGNNVDENDAMNMNGGFGVWGVVAIDGRGCLKAGSNGVQIVYDGNIFNSVKSYGTVGLVQNTWRELPAG